MSNPFNNTPRANNGGGFKESNRAIVAITFI